MDVALEKIAAGVVDSVGGGVGGLMNLLLKGMSFGAAAGGAVGYGYNALGEALGGNDPKQAFNDRIASIYKNRERELSDAKWMDRVRGMRDDLKRNHKKMTPDEYRTMYNALIDALDERRG
jgi:hypothetical protein